MLGGKLYTAQVGICFYCPNPMDAIAYQDYLGNKHHNGYTKDHVFPRSTTGWGLDHNLVLAHAKCNGRKKDREPTDDEVRRTIALYQSMGLEAFVQMAHPAWETQSYWRRGHILIVSRVKFGWSPIQEESVDVESNAVC